MTFKEIVKDHWVNMDNVVSVVIDHDGEIQFTTHHGDWMLFEIDKLINTPEHWRNWLRERS